jgi:hypothetical protein
MAFVDDPELCIKLAPGHIKNLVQKQTHDPVNYPSHYTSHPSGVECIQITRHMTFNVGNAIKYLWRAGKKQDQIQDLKKAAFYIADEITRLEMELEGK